MRVRYRLSPHLRSKQNNDCVVRRTGRLLREAARDQQRTRTSWAGATRTVLRLDSAEESSGDQRQRGLPARETVELKKS